MRNMLFFASHESRRSCKTEIRDGSVSDLSRICLPRGPADFCTRICVGKTRYLIRDGSVSDPRRVRSDFTHEVPSFLYRPCCTKPQSFDPRRIRDGSETDPSRICTRIRICKTVENHALLANHEILIVLISTNNGRMIKVRVDLKSHKYQLFKSALQ